MTLQNETLNPLDNAEFLNLTFDCKDKNFNDAIELIGKKLKAGGLRLQDKILCNGIKVVLIAFIRSYKQEVSALNKTDSTELKKRYTAIQRSNGSYIANDETNPHSVSTETLKQIIDKLNALTFIEFHSGYYNKLYEGRGSRCSRARPNEYFIEEFIKPFILQDVTILQAPIPLVILKDKHGKLERNVSSRSLAKINRYKKELKAYNALLKENEITIKDKPDDILLDRCIVQRIFNIQKDLTLGGRFYKAWWHDVGRSYRRNILINGQETIELDYNAHHPRLLYLRDGHHNFSASKDFYSGKKDIARDIIKLCTLIRINSDSHNKAWQATKERLKEKILSKERKGQLANKEEEMRESIRTLAQFRAVIKSFVKRHPALEDYFLEENKKEKNLGLKLQYADSCIAAYIINTLTKERIPVLTVHDSFIVQKSHEERLWEVMEEAFLSIPASFYKASKPKNLAELKRYMRIDVT